ncbi:MAG: BlaI/MecI/CopY family transcriptional regulator [Planctomycetes bacterium]|nr:BlaI/MecI/CopY family transcriptional regulator [Planctomycetota bacterium]MBI3847219.1 BlaI/MecI/CopY family transcriptional regulator [Planctomycetota bacterium]
MRDRAKGITGAELKVLKILWRLGAGTVRDVKDALTSKAAAPAYTTVMTLMNQLAAKDFLLVDREREPFVYRPAVSREQVLRDRVQSFLRDVFDGQAGELVLRLVEDADLSADDLREIEAKIDAREVRDRRAPARRRKGAKS